MEIDELEKIIGILKTSDVTEFEFEKGGSKIKLTRGVNYGPAQPVPLPEVRQAVPLAATAPAPQVGREASIDPNLVKVESPIVGTFYRKPSPDAEPFVTEGTMVKKGDTLCIIEAMKLMNEIEAPVSGKLEKILLSDGKVVEYGELLFLINPNV